MKCFLKLEHLPGGHPHEAMQLDFHIGTMKGAYSAMRALFPHLVFENDEAMFADDFTGPLASIGVYRD